MAFSGDSKHTAVDILEVMPQDLVRIIPPGVTEIIYDYSFDARDREENSRFKSSIWFKQPAALYTFFGIPSSQKQILALAQNAGPPDRIEAYIRKAHARNESHLQSTLIQAIKLAIIGLDQTICDEEGAELDEGIAEKLLMLHAELFPNLQSDALRQATLAAPLEDEKAKKTREDANFAAVNQVFEAFKKNDKTKPAAIEEFEKFIINSKPKVMTDNLYNLNLIHLIFVAFDVLRRRGGELPRIEVEEGIDNGQWSGCLADQFCIEVIGGAIERNLPPRMAQILMRGASNLLSGTINTKSYRKLFELHIFGNHFTGDIIDRDGSIRRYSLGFESYYSDKGHEDLSEGSHTLDNSLWLGTQRQNVTTSCNFLKLVQAITSASKVYYKAASSFDGPMSNNVKSQRNPTT